MKEDRWRNVKLTGQRTFILLNIDFSSSVPFPPPPIDDQIYPYSITCCVLEREEQDNCQNIIN